ncbi:MAG: hypothetical protein FJX78_00370 [Armatimonadetes bacterium]|nr:hypothetical protein [Armatimonadota bacterium]
MPLYEYECRACGHRFERKQSVGAAAPECPKCGAAVKRLFSPPGIVFRGSGFHVTDYRKPAPTGDAPAAATSSSKSPATSTNGPGATPAPSAAPTSPAPASTSGSSN